MTDVIIRDVADADLELLFQYQADPESTRMAALPARERVAFDLHWAKIRADATVVLRTIVVHGQVAGSLVTWEHAGERMIGYWLGRDYWGRGIATDALTQFLRLIPTRPLYAYVASHNLGSSRVLAKCGFRRATEPTVGDDGVEEATFVLDRPGPA